MTKKVYIIAGPTASGKSALALKLAKQVAGQIVNADSLQVYEDVPLLTARPTPEEMQGIPHHLYGYLDAKANLNVADWIKSVQSIIGSIDTPVFVGGTGMYIQTLMQGLSPMPDIPEDIRASVRQMSKQEILSKLKTPVPLTDTQRLMRALEVELATGKSILFWQSQPKIPVLTNVSFKSILVMPPREKLYTQCNYRFNQMMSSGALHQVIDLYHKNPSCSGGVFKAIGVKELIDFILAQTTLDHAIELACQHTRNYAKRQTTWFAHQFKPDSVVSNAQTVNISDLI